MEPNHARETRWQAVELKFVVTPDCAANLKNWARQKMQADPFSSPEMGDAYLTTSLYFDTPGFDVFHENGSYGNAKYRVRRYGEMEQVFLERKLKNRMMVVKRRSLVGIGDLFNLRDSAVEPTWHGYWFQRRIAARKVKPVCQIAYRRTARVMDGETGLLRLTVDEDLRAMPVSAVKFDHAGETVSLLDDAMIVEMKYRGTTPALFAEAIQEFGLVPKTVSKYKLAARRLALVSEAALEAAA